MTLAAFLSILLIHLLGAISPGPAFVVIVRTAAVDGFRSAVLAAVGLGLGAICWALAALLGLNLLFEVAPSALLAFKFAGAAFLLWIAWQTFLHAETPLPQMEKQELTPRADRSALRLGLVTQLSNSKIAVFFGAVFIGIVPHDAPVWALALIMAMIFLDEKLWYTFVGRVFSLSYVRSLYGNAKRWVDRAFSALIAAFAARIVMT